MCPNKNTLCIKQCRETHYTNTKINGLAGECINTCAYEYACTQVILVSKACVICVWA